MECPSLDGEPIGSINRLVGTFPFNSIPPIDNSPSPSGGSWEKSGRLALSGRFLQRRYNEVTNEVNDVYQSGFFPDILYRVQF